MRLPQRLLYFGSGFAIGVILLMFFLGGKRASCDYGPTARTLKNIRSKEIHFEQGVLNQIRSSGLDTADVNMVLREGDVDFAASQTHLDSCRVYSINGETDKGLLLLEIRNCEKQAKVTKAQLRSP